MIVGYFLLTGVIETVIDVFNTTEHRSLLAMLDPFGAAAYEEVTRYWTAFERNARPVGFSGLVMWNRLLWLALSALVLGFTVKRFRFDVQPRSGRRKRARTDNIADDPLAVAVRTPRVIQVHGLATQWRQLLVRSLFEARTVVFSVPFLVLVLLAVMITVVNFLALDQFYWTSSTRPPSTR